MFFERLEDFLDRPLQLRVAIFGHEAGIIDDFDVGLDAVAFDDPVAFGVVDAKGRHRHTAAIDQRRRAGDADEAAPGAQADERAEAGLPEIIGKAIAS